MAKFPFDDEEYRKRLAANPYQPKVDEYLSKLENDPGFDYNKYNLAGDKLYQVYSDIYAKNAKKAMDDTIARSNFRNAGLGTSYSQYAGQQAYNEQMGKLNEMIPQLYQLAEQRYNTQRQRDEGMLSAYQSAAQYHDTMAQKQFENQQALREYDDKMKQQQWENQRHVQEYEDTQRANAWSRAYNQANSGITVAKDENGNYVGTKNAADTGEKENYSFYDDRILPGVELQPAAKKSLDAALYRYAIGVDDDESLSNMLVNLNIGGDSAAKVQRYAKMLRSTSQSSSSSSKNTSTSASTSAASEDGFDEDGFKMTDNERRTYDSRIASVAKQQQKASTVTDKTKDYAVTLASAMKSGKMSQKAAYNTVVKFLNEAVPLNIGSGSFIGSAAIKAATGSLPQEELSANILEAFVQQGVITYDDMDKILKERGAL